MSLRVDVANVLRGLADRLDRVEVVGYPAPLLPSEDPRMLAVAHFYGLSLNQVRALIATGHRIGHALGRTLLFPPAPPRPPARDK